MTPSIQEQVVGLLKEVARLNGISLPPGATEEAIVEFENSTGISLPPELKEWLRTCNGPNVSPGGLYGVAPAVDFLSIQKMLEWTPEWEGKGWIPVAGDGCGNYYVLDSHSGVGIGRPIYFIDHEVSYDEPCYVVASNLWQFLRFLLQKELIWAQGEQYDWPFDKERVLADDPDLARYGGAVPLPWEAD